ncbi:hypothetical protein, partial [Prevotella histicola]
LSLRNRIKRKSLSYNNLGIFITPTSTLDPLFDPVLTHFFSPKNRLCDETTFSCKDISQL